jgi:hypothetical protein
MIGMDQNPYQPPQGKGDPPPAASLTLVEWGLLLAIFAMLVAFLLPWLPYIPWIHPRPC